MVQNTIASNASIFESVSAAANVLRKRASAPNTNYASKAPASGGIVAGNVSARPAPGSTVLASDKNGAAVVAEVPGPYTLPLPSSAPSSNMFIWLAVGFGALMLLRK